MSIQDIVVRGVKYKADDCVYLKPESKDESYYVGRIMEFVPSKTETNGAMLPRIKVAWFSRPNDIQMGGARKKHFDHRLLVGTMTHDLNPASSIVGKCRIMHIAAIKNLDEYKSYPDNFYYHQVYDRYTMRLYDVLPLDTVKNLPERVIQALQAYEYILVEEGKAAGFTTKRTCGLCQSWCSPDEEVLICSGCPLVFHLDCMGINKPSKGYAWYCMQCVRRLEGTGDTNEEKIDRNPSIDSVESITDSISTVFTSPAPPPHIQKPVFPFRYYGEYSTVDDLLDNPDDTGHPKASSRLGRNYQAEVPDWIPPNQSNNINVNVKPDGFEAQLTALTKPKRRPKIGGAASKVRHEVEVDRYAINEVIYDGPLMESLGISPDAYTQQLKQLAERVNLNGFLWDSLLDDLYKHRLDLQAMDTNLLSSIVAADKKQSLTEREAKAFESGVKRFGHELSWIRREHLPQRSINDVVLHFYLWKKSPRYVPVYSQFCKIFRPKKKFKTPETEPKSPKEVVVAPTVSSISSSDEEQYKHPSPAQCGSCLATTTAYRHTVAAEGKGPWCLKCFDYFKRYGYAQWTADAKKRRAGRRSKREVALDEMEELKRQKLPSLSTNSNQAIKGPHSLSAEAEDKLPINNRCAVCFHTSFSDPLLICVDCKLHVHKQCYGVTIDTTQYFRCDRCTNMATPKLSLDYLCVLCETNVPNRRSPLKRTIGNCWAHVQCAIWHPEVKFADVVSLERVECIPKVDKDRWYKQCRLCHYSGGACISCSEPGCYATSHVICVQHSKSWSLFAERCGTSGIVLGMRCGLHNKKTSEMDEEDFKSLVYDYVCSTKLSNVGDLTMHERRSASQNLAAVCTCHTSAHAHEDHNVIHSNDTTMCVNSSSSSYSSDELTHLEDDDDGSDEEVEVPPGTCDLCRTKSKFPTWQKEDLLSVKKLDRNWVQGLGSNVQHVCNTCLLIRMREL